MIECPDFQRAKPLKHRLCTLFHTPRHRRAGQIDFKLQVSPSRRKCASTSKGTWKLLQSMCLPTKENCWNLSLRFTRTSTTITCTCEVRTRNWNVQHSEVELDLRHHRSMNNKDCRSMSCMITGASTTSTANPTFTRNRPTEAPTGPPYDRANPAPIILVVKQPPATTVLHRIPLAPPPAIAVLKVLDVTSSPSPTTSHLMRAQRGCSSARAPSHPPARRPLHFFPTGRSAKNPLIQLFTRDCGWSCHREKTMKTSTRNRNVIELLDSTLQRTLDLGENLEDLHCLNPHALELECQRSAL